MTALVDTRASSFKTVVRDLRPLATGVKAIKGGLAACKVTGFFGPATGDPDEVIVGRFYETVDNTTGANGAKSANVDHFRERTVFLLVNASVAPVTVTSRERACYAEDDQTVSADDGATFCGVVYDVTNEGVWVEMGAGPRGPQGEAG
jgi:hypothetical protein